MFSFRNASYVLGDIHPTLHTEKLTEKNWKQAQVFFYFLSSDLLISDSIYLGSSYLDIAFSIREAVKYSPVIIASSPKNTRLN